MQAPIITRFRRRITQFLTHKPKYPVPTFKTYTEIVNFMGRGSLWTADPGIRDPLFHPTHSVKKIVTKDESMSMDCDDHATLWCAILLKSGMAEQTYIGSFGMINEKGEKSWHAICLFERGGRRYWCDYNEPREYYGKWEWATQCGAGYASKPFEATIYEIKKLRNDTPIFGGYDTTKL